MIELGTRHPQTDRRPSSEEELSLPGGARLFYRAWMPRGHTRTALVLLHRGHEHSGRWQETVDGLGLEDVAVFAWDARGHGRSPGERGAADHFSLYTADLDCFVRHLCQAHGLEQEDLLVLGHSVGAVVAAAWVHDYAPRIRGLILAAPAFRVRLYVPLAIPLLRLRQKLLGPGFVKSYVKPGLLTRDEKEARKYSQDPAIFRQIAVNVLLDLHDASTRLLEDAAAITVPTLLLAAGSDWVVKVSAQRRFFERLGSPVKEFHLLPRFRHAVFHEKEPRLAIERIRAFVRQRIAEAPRRHCLLEADRSGHTREEYDRLRGRRGLRYAMMRTALRTLGRLSSGIRLGWERGFDSGASLDYVYRNQPQGFSPLGRLVDRSYLRSMGWRGIRQRRANLQETLREAVWQVHAAGLPVRVLDIACGTGRYVLETVADLRGIPVSVHLRDADEQNLQAARDLAGQLGLTGLQAVRGDAFDRAGLAAIRPRPTVALVSGLYELFPENRPVLGSLRGLAEALEPGGLLIYTGQPWHPQLEFIARVLDNREGKPWVMRRRTQAELDELVSAAGFRKLSQRIDRWGIFTVSLARREEL